MSVQKCSARLTVPEILARKGQEPIVCLTSYHAHTAALIDPHVDVMLVGDSLGMVMYGICLLYTSPSPRDPKTSRMPSSA